MFSSRLPRSLTPNPLTMALVALRSSGATWIDLTETNPTAVGIDYPTDTLSALADPRAIRYAPDARGLQAAREAIAADYARRGRPVSPGGIVVTASTSEAYSILFKLLCDPGDEVLVPQPSYPLFDLLAGLEAVSPKPYRLVEHDDWTIDRRSVLDALSPAVRAVLVVSPNNPTGSLLRAEDWAWLTDECGRRGVAIIVDEVFADYPLATRPGAAHVSGREPALTFALGGLSKSAGLPQVKLGWIAVGGPDAMVSESLDRLDVICDTYLSVATPVQMAAPALIAAGAAIQHAIHDRVRRNLVSLRERIRAQPALTFRDPEAGWSAVMQFPAVESEESLVLRLLTQGRVLVHPGYFFDFGREAFLVVSLLPAPEVFDEGVDRVLRAIDGTPR